MTDLAALASATAALKDTKADFLVAAKDALREALTEAFSNPNVETVAWTQKYSEYNDEGLYPGIEGPVINVVDADYPTADLWDWAGYGSPPATDFSAEATVLRSVLTQIGENTICEIVGDDNNIVVAARANNEKGYNLYAEYVGY